MNGLGMDNHNIELYSSARAGDKTGLAVLLDRHGIKTLLITNGLFLRGIHKKRCVVPKGLGHWNSWNWSDSVPLNVVKPFIKTGLFKD